MAIVIVGGHSRNVGKTSVVADLITALPEFNWTAFKITQYGHGVCSANGEPCDCATHDRRPAITREKDRTGGSDTSRFLAAGAREVFWVRTKQGYLAEAMPRLRKLIGSAENAIIESNSAMGFLRPDLYLMVVDPAKADFKDSARLFLDRADAILALPGRGTQQWRNVSMKLMERKRIIEISPDNYVTDEVAAFVRQRLTVVQAVG